MSYDLLISFVLSYIATLLFTPHIIDYFKKIGLVSRDFHKKDKPLIPSSAGIPVIVGLFAGVMFYVFSRVFFYNDESSLLELFAGLTTIMLATFVGFLDDLNTRQVYYAGSEGHAGLKRWVKPLLVLPAAIPLMVINAGHTTAVLPLIGTVDFGILYPLVVIPIGVLIGANMINMTAGYNGIEAGMGAIYTFALGIFSFIHGSPNATLLFLSTFAALVAILKFNFVPAKILPGDSITYLLGAVLATGAIIGNVQKAAIIAVLPLFFNAAYKVYLKFFKLGYFPGELGILQKDGSIKSKYKKSYTLINFILHHGRFSERQLVLIMMGIEAVFSLLIFVKLY